MSIKEVFNLNVFELGRPARPGRQYRPVPAEGQKNPGDTGSQPKQLHIGGDTKTTNKHLPVLDPMVIFNIF
jgi:hypothetical protein